jgi:hypothetical protein
MLLTKENPVPQISRESGKREDLCGSEKRQVEGCRVHDIETCGLRENQDIS